MTLICGVNPVLEALAAGTRNFDRLLVVKGLRGRRLADAIHRATRLGIPIRFEMRETLDRLAGGVPHQGIIAIVSEKPVLSLEQLLEATREPALLVALDGIEDPRNLGAILRTCEAAGADGVLLPERHSAGISETVARASAGAVEHVRVARVGNLSQALEALKARGIWVVGFDAAGSERWDAIDLTRPVALVLGGEGRGMRRLVREHCDHLASIPHFGQVSSLNVSVAAGIALYEAVRQRRAVPSLVRPIPQRAPVKHVIGPQPGDGAGGDEGLGPEEPLPGDDGPAPDDEGDAIVAVPPPLDFHEDVAWGRGPTVLKPIEFPRARRPGRREKPRRRWPAPRPAARRDENHVQEPSVGGETGAAPRPAEGRTPGAPPRRRRRRRGGGGRRDEAHQPMPGGENGSRGEAPAAADREPGAANDGRPGGRRRRRRRRR